MVGSVRLQFGTKVCTRVRRRHARTVLSLSLLLGVFTCHGVASNTSAPNSSLVMGNVAFRDVLELWMSNVAFRESLWLLKPSWFFFGGVGSSVTRGYAAHL